MGMMIDHFECLFDDNEDDTESEKPEIDPANILSNVLWLSLILIAPR